MSRNSNLEEAHSFSRYVQMFDRSSQFTPDDLNRIEKSFTLELKSSGMDERVHKSGTFFAEFENALGWAIAKAFPKNNKSKLQSIGRLNALAVATEADSQRAALFAHRILYSINRLRLFWFDDLQDYTNEDSFYLQACRRMIEEAWQSWAGEQLQVDLKNVTSENAAETLLNWASKDNIPGKPSEEAAFFARSCTLADYDSLLEITSLDALVEASHLSRMLGGASCEIQAVLMKLLMEEYGAGRISRKHSSYFARMMHERGLSTVPEAFLDKCPWERLAGINQEFYFTENKRHFLRAMGSLLYTEVSTPVGFAPILAASQRLGVNLSENYWALHIQEDARHGKWMIEEVAIPLLDKYPLRAREMLEGYVVQKQSDRRSTRAIVKLLSA